MVEVVAYHCWIRCSALGEERWRELGGGLILGSFLGALMLRAWIWGLVENGAV